MADDRADRAFVQRQRLLQVPPLQACVNTTGEKQRARLRQRFLGEIDADEVRAGMHLRERRECPTRPATQIEERPFARLLKSRARNPWMGCPARAKTESLSPTRFSWPRTP